MIWRGIALAGVLTVSLWFGPWPLTLALIVGVCYAVIVHQGWSKTNDCGKSRRCEIKRCPC